jgi:hypothetical protein
MSISTTENQDPAGGAASIPGAPHTPTPFPALTVTGRSNGVGAVSARDRRRTSKRWKIPPAPSEGASYQALRQHIRTGDLLLFRGNYLLSHVIETLSDSPYSHVAILARWKDRVVAFQADTRGVEILPVSKMVCRYNGKVDWWSRVAGFGDTAFEEKLLDTALTLLGTRYGYWPLISLGFRILLGRTLSARDAHATPDSLFCSQFVSECYRVASDGRFDVNPNLNDASTSPADFVRSGHFVPRYQLFDGSGGAACDASFDLGSAGGDRSRRRSTWNGTRLLPDPPRVNPAGAPPAR